jgi:hypothetical protein
VKLSSGQSFAMRKLRSAWSFQLSGAVAGHWRRVSASARTRSAVRVQVVALAVLPVLRLTGGYQWVTTDSRVITARLPEYWKSAT